MFFSVLIDKMTFSFNFIINGITDVQKQARAHPFIKSEVFWKKEQPASLLLAPENEQNHILEQAKSQTRS